jgi:hypothetical protein
MVTKIPNIWEFAQEREQVRLRREAGKSKPWTDDRILQSFFFCNIYREDDKTTLAFKDTVRDPLYDDPRVMMATIGWRWFNKIETCGSVSAETWATGDTKTMYDAFLPYYLAAVDPKNKSRRTQESASFITAAYMVKTPPGYNKLDGLLHHLDVVREHFIDNLITVAQESQSLEKTWEALIEVPYLGPFLAYEIVSDLRWTGLLCNATDIMTWANIGPGCMRGLGYYMGVDDVKKDMPHYMSKKARALGKKMLPQLLAENQLVWPKEWRPFEMREVEHTLCEYSKYRSALEGRKQKRLYQGQA